MAAEEKTEADIHSKYINLRRMAKVRTFVRAL
jgi:hypothetical protein